ncbi:hypothetical protein RHMOL_Rhmol04G0229300 [Rhododendron molle]|uniref:Uncharacterized protein n=1 Tax=Rhododendron molle TaxID=49168 RepID=A0ACC0P4N7_RHOML|nr:hypothetical protein RHMOL_Rhmol04G0229300 [Rhododendron molle]
MDFASQFPVLRSSSLGRNPSLSPVSPKGLVFGSGTHGNIIDHLERVTVENTDHLCIDDTDGPIAKQIKSLNAEIQYLRKELESKKPIAGVQLTGVASPKPTWTDVVTQDPGGPRMNLSFHPPQVKEAKVVVCPPEDVVEAGIAKWNNCVVGSLPTEEVVITQLVPDLSLTVSEKSQGKRVVVTAASISECVSPPVVGSGLNTGQCSIAKSGNSFSVLAELDHIAGKEELDGVAPILVGSVPHDSPDLLEVVMPLTRARGRGKGKVDRPIPKKGVGGESVLYSLLACGCLLYKVV